MPSNLSRAWGAGRGGALTWPMSLMSSMLLVQAGGAAAGATARPLAFVQLSTQRLLGVPGSGVRSFLSACPSRLGLRRGMCTGPPNERHDSSLSVLQKVHGLKAMSGEGSAAETHEASGWEDGSEFTPEHAPGVIEAEIYDQLSEGGTKDPNQVLQGFLDEKEVEDYKFTGDKRCGTVAIVGAPNAGKSTLLNHLIGSKLAIVTHKRQTTRNSVTGIAMEDGTQVIYIDTPGIMDARPGERLNKAMVKQAWNCARDADEIFFIVDADKILPGRDGKGVRGTEGGASPVDVVKKERLFLREDTNEGLVLRRLCERHQEFNLILNKVDQLRGERKSLLLPLAEAIKEQATKQDESGTYVKKVYAVSAVSGKGTDAIREYLKKNLPISEWHYPTDQISDIPLRQIVAEITRESILLRAHEEIPYVCYVETEQFTERPDGSVRIQQLIFVETEGQKKILIGMIKDLGMRSRREMMKFLDQTVHLFLNVKVKKWTDTSKAMYERIGLDFDA